MARHTINELRQWQALPLSIKIRMTMERIRMWVREYGEDGVYVSFSGGKDSTVLLDIVRNRMGYKEIPAVFVDTGLEYPEIREFVKTFDNVVWLKPKMQFRKVIEKYGYPMFSKENALYIRQCQHPTENNKTTQRLRIEGIRSDGTKVNHGVIPSGLQFAIKAPFNISEKCCDVMKKAPLHGFLKKTGRKPMTAQMADESRIRKTKWLQHGCNYYDGDYPISNPMSFWTEQDVLRYIKDNNLTIASVYGDIVIDENDTDQLVGQLEFGADGIEEVKCTLKTTGCDRTGCMYCGFGCHREGGAGRFVKMKETHPKIYEWVFRDWEQGGLGYKKVIDWLNEHGNLNIKY